MRQCSRAHRNKNVIRGRHLVGLAALLLTQALAARGAAAAPPTPAKPTPGSRNSPGPTLSSSTVTLEWSSSRGATYYDLGVRDLSTDVLVVKTRVSSPSYTATLTGGRPYRWSVAACNASGCSSFTARRYFITPERAPATPRSPTPGSTSSPGPTLSSSTVALDWSLVSGAAYYDLAVRDLSTHELVVDTRVRGSTYTATLAEGRPYRWNVAACNDSGCSSFTAPRYFRTPESSSSSAVDVDDQNWK